MCVRIYITEMSKSLNKPIKHGYVFPGLADALAEKEAQIQDNRVSLNNG